MASDIPSPLPLLSRLLPVILAHEHVDAVDLSNDTRRATHYLNLSPDDTRYWQLGKQDTRVTLQHDYATQATGLDDVQPGEPLYTADAESIRCAIPLRLSRQSRPDTRPEPPLAVVLSWDTEYIPVNSTASNVTAPSPSDNVGTANTAPLPSSPARPAWTFLTLALAPTTANSDWHATLEAALESAAPKMLLMQVSDYASEPPRKSPPISISTRTKPRDRQEMAEGEGTTPGAYGAADDFWAGYSDSEDEREREDGQDGHGQEPTRYDNRGDGDDDDSSYWNSYDSRAEPQIEHEEERSAARDPSSNAVDNEHDLADRLSLDTEIESLYLDDAAATTATAAAGRSSAATATQAATYTERAAPAAGTASTTRSRRSSTIRPPAASVIPDAAHHLPERFKPAAVESTSLSLSQLPSPEPSPLPTPPSISPRQQAALTSSLRASLPGASTGGGDNDEDEDDKDGAADAKKLAQALKMTGPAVGDGEDDMSSLGSEFGASREQSRGASRGASRAASRSASLSVAGGGAGKAAASIAGPATGGEPKAANGAISPSRADESVRFALAGVWALYKSAARADHDGNGDEDGEIRKRFEAIVAQVVRS